MADLFQWMQALLLAEKFCCAVKMKSSHVLAQPSAAAEPRAAEPLCTPAGTCGRPRLHRPPLHGGGRAVLALTCKPLRRGGPRLLTYLFAICSLA